MTHTLASVATPVGVVDLAVARQNAERVVGYCREHGLTWRPHVKTHKSRDVAALQLAAGARGLTVATPHEAEVMATVCDDLLLAYPPVGADKLARIMALPGSVRLTVALDSVPVLEGLAAASRAEGRTTGVLVEVDAGLRRVGVQSAGEAVELGQRVRELGGVEYRGIMFYPGHIRGPIDDQDADLARLADWLAALRESLEGQGLAPDVVSGGSTPTLWRTHEVPGVTEVRAGTAIFNDREQIAVGSAAAGDLAYSVLATVVSTAVPGQAVVDAGSKALAKEERGGEGFGSLLERPGIRVRALSEEHGILDLSGTDWRPRIGERVRIVPNHVCVSVNLQDHVLVVDDGDGRLWPLEGRGRGPFAPSPVAAAGAVP
ncbi:MAG TPA: alanine racemase [Longimicrobiales bacterium]